MNVASTQKILTTTFVHLLEIIAQRTQSYLGALYGASSNDKMAGLDNKEKLIISGCLYPTRQEVSESCCVLKQLIARSWDLNTVSIGKRKGVLHIAMNGTYGLVVFIEQLKYGWLALNAFWGLIGKRSFGKIYLRPILILLLIMAHTL